MPDTPSPVSPLPFDGERLERYLSALNDAIAALEAEANDESAKIRYRTSAAETAHDLCELRELLPALLDARKDGERWRFAQKYGVDMDYSDCVYVYRGPAGGDTYESIDEAIAAAHAPEPADVHP